MLVWDAALDLVGAFARTHGDAPFRAHALRFVGLLEAEPPGDYLEATLVHLVTVACCRAGDQATALAILRRMDGRSPAPAAAAHLDLARADALRHQGEMARALDLYEEVLSALDDLEGKPSTTPGSAADRATHDPASSHPSPEATLAWTPALVAGPTLVRAAALSGLAICLRDSETATRDLTRARECLIAASGLLADYDATGDAIKAADLTGLPADFWCAVAQAHLAGVQMNLGSVCDPIGWLRAAGIGGCTECLADYHPTGPGDLPGWCKRRSCGKHPCFCRVIDAGALACLASLESAYHSAGRALAAHEPAGLPPGLHHLAPLVLGEYPDRAAIAINAGGVCLLRNVAATSPGWDLFRDDISQGHDALDRATEWYGRAPATRQGHDRRYQAIRHFNLAHLHGAQGRIAEALDECRRSMVTFSGIVQEVVAGLPEESSLALLRYFEADVDLMLTLAFSEQGDPRIAEDRVATVAGALMARKGLVLNGPGGRLAALARSGDEEVRRLYRELVEARLKLSAYAMRLAADPTNSRRDRKLHDLRAECNRREHRVRGLLGDRPVPREDVGVRNIAAALPPGGVLVDYTLYHRLPLGDTEGVLSDPQPRYMATVVSGAGGYPIRMVDLGPAGPIDQAVKVMAHRLASRARQWEKKDARGSSLRNLVWDPIARTGLLADATRVVICPGGSLHQVPFELPAGGEEGASPAFSYVVSPQDLVRIRHRPGVASGTSRKAVIFAGLDYDRADGLEHHVDHAAPTVASGQSRRQADQLPWTRFEGDSVSRVLGECGAEVEWVADGAGTESRIQQVERPWVLHLATHGMYTPKSGPPPTADPYARRAWEQINHLAELDDPLLRTGVALSGANIPSEVWAAVSDTYDGTMTGLDVTTLDLRDTELVTLSACQTGLGEAHRDEGVFGLRRAIDQAGAHSLVISLWSVNDLATTLLMGRFYERLVGSGDSPPMPRDQALAEARGYVRDLTNADLRCMGIDRQQPEGVPTDIPARAGATRGADGNRSIGKADTDRPFSHPYYWAGFILQGETGPLTLPGDNPGGDGG